MRYHVPFSQRNRTPGPVYIGFDEPVSIQKRKGRFNWCGFTGLLMALISPLTLFIIAPLALLLSFLGMRRSPRGMAFVGLMLSILATSALSIGIYHVAQERAEQQRRHHARIVAVQNREAINETRATMDIALVELREYRADNNDQLPDIEEGMMMTVTFDDGWEKPLRYGVEDEGCIIRSAGPDQEFDTTDDLTVTLEGTPKSWSMGQDLVIE